MDSENQGIHSVKKKKNTARKEKKKRTTFLSISFSDEKEKSQSLIVLQMN